MIVPADLSDIAGVISSVTSVLNNTTTANLLPTVPARKQ